MKTLIAIAVVLLLSGCHANKPTTPAGDSLFAKCTYSTEDAKKYGYRMCNGKKTIYKVTNTKVRSDLRYGSVW